MVHTAEIHACQIHDPVQVLTASTAANAGRQFYKCSHASEAEACLKFQWADEAGGGNENNRNAANAPQGRFGGVTGICYWLGCLCGT